MWRASDSRLDYWPRCDGAILAGADPESLDRVCRNCRNVIVCSGGADPKRTAVVALDDRAAGELAANHLMDCRLEKFAYYGLAAGQLARVKRFDGFRNSLAKRNFECIACPVTAPSGREWITHAHRPRLMKWLRALPKPIGIFAFDDASAHDLAAACLNGNIGVPEHVAIIGVNNDDLLCESAWPPLSSIEADFSRMGYAAAKMLDAMLKGKKFAASARFVTFPPLGVVQ